MIMKIVKMTESQARDKNIASGFLFGDYKIVIVPDRNPELPPVVEIPSGHTHVAATQYAPTPEDQPERKVTVVTVGRVDDGVIHQRQKAKSYVRRPSKIGGRRVQCKNWASETHEIERLAALLGFESLEQLLEDLAVNGVPAKSTCERVATELNRSVGSVTAKLRDLRRKALVTRK